MKIPAPVLALVVTLFAADSAAAQATQPAKIFRLAIAQIQDKAEVAILLPSTLPTVLRNRDISVARGTTSDGGYTIELRYEGVAGNARFAALFAGSKGVEDIIHPLRGTHRSRLANGIEAIFGPVSCGGSCAPANLWWATPSFVVIVLMRGPPSPWRCATPRRRRQRG
jgi:hypothetical protein